MNNKKQSLQRYHIGSVDILRVSRNQNVNRPYSVVVINLNINTCWNLAR